ncbi:MAG: cache domain-containing protein [Rhodospirillales bacterium]|nr:cache domain-containing protein [Rhodospirillales bacterium]
MRNVKTALAAALIGAFIAPAYATDYGTPAEAKAMLEKAAIALKANQAAALQEFTAGEDGFKEKDLYPYCGGPDGKFTAHPKLVGQSLMDLMDKGTPPKPLGKEVYAAAQPGKITEVSYMWPRPGETEAVQKVVYVTKVGDQVCGVGYYKQ